MLAQFAGALEHESGYTEESFTAFQTAYQEAQSYYQQHGLVGTSVSASVLNGYQRHAAALWSAYYEGLESAKETISVSLRVADSQVAYDLASPDGAELGLPPSEGIYENPDVSLSGAGRTVAGLGRVSRAPAAGERQFLAHVKPPNHGRGLRQRHSAPGMPD